MTLVLIKTFLAIVETGSLVKASKVLNVTQSTITSRLKSLEEDIGQTLIHRQKSGIVLTPPGTKLHRYAEAMNNMWQQALLETSLPKGIEAICNLGCDPDLWPQHGRDFAKRLGFQHKATALNIHRANSSQLEEKLVSGSIDSALTYHRTNLPNMTTVELEPEQLELFSTSPDTPVRGDPDYVYFDAGPDFGKQHATAYSDAGVANHTFDSAIWTMDFIIDNGGSAYLPVLLAAPQVAKKNLYPLKDAPIFSRKVFLIANEKGLSNWQWFFATSFA